MFIHSCFNAIGKAGELRMILDDNRVLPQKGSITVWDWAKPDDRVSC